MSASAKKSRLVYFIQCHSHANHVFDLFRYLHNTGDDFVFCPDAKSDRILHHTILSLSQRFTNVHVIEPGLISWGGFSIVKSMIAGMNFAIQHLADWSHFVNLSGQHLPLRSAHEIAQRLESAKTYISASSFDPENAERAKDLMHRFGMLYQEVPGVGAFGKSDRHEDEFLKILLYSGSNWMVLSKEMCEIMITSAAIKPLLAYFEGSLFSDETALQTIILGTGFGTHLPVEKKALTFVADPSRGGTPEMIFTEKNFWEAKEADYLFIRKRPDFIPDQIKHYLKSLIIEKDGFELDRPTLGLSIQTDHSDAQAIFDELADMLISNDPTLKIQQLRPTDVICPRLYMQVRHAYGNDKLFVAVLSENLVDFKVSLIWFDHFRNGYSTKHLDGYKTTVLKVRVHDLAFNREIHVSADASRGFLSINVPGKLRYLSEIVLAYVDVSKRLSLSIEVD